MDVYVILASWNDVLYRLEAWSKNYYLASIYFRQFKRKHPDAIFKIYKGYGSCQIMQLAHQLKMECDTKVEDFIESELKLTASRDDKLCAIYKARYLDSFTAKSSDIDSGIYDEVTSIMSSIFLSSAPLVKFLYLDNDLLELLFITYSYTSKLSKAVELDMVYMWFFLLKINRTSFISDFHRNIIPIDTVFIRVDEY